MPPPIIIGCIAFWGKRLGRAIRVATLRLVKPAKSVIGFHRIGMRCASRLSYDRFG